MGNGATSGAKRSWPVELAVSELGGVVGCKAYHTSVIIDGAEYAFSDEGIVAGAGIASHGELAVVRKSMGSTTVHGEALRDQLVAYFAPGTYDLLRKNCNSFSDVALVVLVGKRLDQKYRQLEKVGMRFPHLVTTLSSGEYRPNRQADDFDLERLCADLRFGPSWAARGHEVGDECSAGEMAKDHAKAGASRTRRKRNALARVHILPFLDTFELNFDHMYRTYIIPYIRDPAVSDLEHGRGLHVGDEFSACGGRVRFRVVSCEPPEGGIPSEKTLVYYEGDPIERTVLNSVTVLPLESSMALLAGKTPAELERDFVAPVLEQRSADLLPGHILDIRGARFKVVGTDPASGGGPSAGTRLVTTGPPVKVCSVDGCDSAPVKLCREKGCKNRVCIIHAADVKETSCLCPLHAPTRRGVWTLFGAKAR